MANLGEKLTVGDREGVVVRAVSTAEGLELTVLVPDDSTTRPVSVGVQDVEAAEIVAEGTPNNDRLVDADPDAPASQPQTGDDKPLTTNKAAADRKTAADRKPADRKAGDTK